ncbi:MAG: hypothetical protein KC439_06670 [Yoonia sp.]|nr:hypothetical protein [Yoonia sp.]
MEKPSTSVAQIKRLIEDKSDDSSAVVLRETSKSWIFLAQDRVYKLKKQVRDDLQDLTSLRARFDNCLTEVDLNRRLARETYLGVTRVVRHSDGTLGLGGNAETVDWLVEMQRLPADKMLDTMAVKDIAPTAKIRSSVDQLAERLTDFYAHCPASQLNASELITIFHDQQKMNSTCLRNPLFVEFHPRFEAVFDALSIAFLRHFPLFETRVNTGWVRECHGDLRPEHICMTTPPLVFDCLEFNRNLRLVDPFSEIMFLGLEADILGLDWIKPALITHLARGLGASPLPDLLALYETQHALLRTRLCLAHLLVPNPRTPAKWLPLGLRYFDVAERRLFGPNGLAR